MKNKRGQVTIFIIIALLLILVAIFIFLVYPRISPGGGFDTENPKAFIQSCVEDDLEDIVKRISIQGGTYEEPLLYDYYNKQKIQYLCYTPNYYELCTKKVAFLRDYIEEEISNAIKEKVGSCFEILEGNYIEKGYGVTLKSDHGIVKTSLLPERIFLEFKNYGLSISKGDNSETYKNFDMRMNSNLRSLVDISTKIVEDEASRLEGVDINQYRMANLDFDILEIKYSEGTNIYVLKEERTGELFQFATRSSVTPPGG